MTSQLVGQTLSFLFTDVEGSTRLWEQHPDAMREAMAEHDALLASAVKDARGDVVKSTGDGVLAVFTSPSEAMEAAIASQRALSGIPPSEVRPLRVRMAVHCGPATARDGDYFGTTLNRAARIMALAHGGQVLASEAAAVLVREYMPADVKLRDLGEHRLRDLTNVERIFQIEADDLDLDFPPLRSLDAYTSNLPAQMTSFVGREHEIDDLVALVRPQRLVTLTGVGGVGKTRLAVRGAAELLPYVRDGVWLCELASADSDDVVDEVVSQTMTITPRAGMSLRESIVEALRDREVVVVLDNCEHVLDAAADLADAILRQCPQVRMIATSREGLGVDGEQLRPVRSLAVPESEAIDVALTSDATALFVERARAITPTFTLDDASAASVVEICRRLDGIPLAIELAAARVASMQPAEIAALLDQRFRLLTGSRRRTIERHQTLRATVDWSYSLLGESERAVFDTLGAFTGTFDATAAQAVAADDRIDRFDVLDALDDLVAKSMLNAEPADDGTTRYQLLETLRQYALDRLEAATRLTEVRRRHAEHYATVTTALGPMLYSPDEIAARARLSRESDNIRAALDWAIDAEEPALVLALIAPIAFEAGWHRLSGIGGWAQRAVAAEPADPPPEWVWIRLAAGNQSFHNDGDYDTALRIAQETLTWADIPADAHAWAASLRCFAMSAATGQFAEAAAQLRDDYESMGYDPGPGALGAVGGVAIYVGLVGEVDAALGYADDTLRQARQIGSPSALAFAHYTRGLVLAQRDLALARGDLEAAGALVGDDLTSDIVADRVPHLLAIIEIREGDNVAAAASLVRALRYSLRAGAWDACANEMQFASTVFDACGRLQEVVFVEEALASGVVPQPQSNPGYEDLVGERRVTALAGAIAALSSEQVADARTRARSLRRAEVVREVIEELELIAST